MSTSEIDRSDANKSVTRKLIPISSNLPPNLCHESGCEGGCCRNMMLPSLNLDEVNTLTPPGTTTQIVDRVEFSNRLASLSSLDRTTPPTTVYIMVGRNRNSAAVIIEGPCPNYDAGCNVYSERPKPCRDMELGSKICNNIRNKLRIGKVSKSGEVQPRHILWRKH